MESLKEVKSAEDKKDWEIEEKYQATVQKSNNNLFSLEMPVYLLNVPFSLSSVEAG